MYLLYCDPNWSGFLHYHVLWKSNLSSAMNQIKILSVLTNVRPDKTSLPFSHTIHIFLQSSVPQMRLGGVGEAVEEGLEDKLSDSAGGEDCHGRVEAERQFPNLTKLEGRNFEDWCMNRIEAG